VLVISSAVLFARSDAPYDPLFVDKYQPSQQDLTVRDQKRSREIPIRVCLPKEKTPAPIVLFSHGLGGSREGSAFLGNHWASRGYVVVFLQHPGSDDSVWKDKQALTTAFWDAYLRDDQNARKWLDGDGPRKVLEKGGSVAKKMRSRELFQSRANGAKCNSLGHRPR
jgi:hypothetical protein